MSRLELVLEKHDLKLGSILKETIREVIIVSPWIKQKAVSIVTDSIKNKNINLRLYTRFNSSDIDKGITDLNAIKNLVNTYKNVEIKFIPNLHAKIYISDKKRAFITSGNLTTGGMKNNIETGVILDDERLVEQLANNVAEMFENALLLDKFAFNDFIQDFETNRQDLNRTKSITFPENMKGAGVSLGRHLLTHKKIASLEQVGKDLNINIELLEANDSNNGDAKSTVWKFGDHGKKIYEKICKNFDELKQIKPEVLEVAFLHSTFINTLSIDDQTPTQERLVSLGRDIIKPIFYLAFHERYGDKYTANLIQLLANYYSNKFIMSGKLFSEIDYRVDLLSGFTFDNEKDIPVKLKSDTNLALMSVIFISIGLEKTISFIWSMLKMDTPLIDLFVENDSKSVVMEVSQLVYRYNPIYKKLRESGTDHEKEFESAILINDKILGTATGKSISESEKNAAIIALHSEELKGALNTWFQKKLKSIQMKRVILSDLSSGRYLHLTPLAKQLNFVSDNDLKLLNKSLTHSTWCNDQKLPVEFCLNNLTTPGVKLFDIYCYYLIFLSPQISNSKLETVKSCLDRQLYRIFDLLELDRYILLKSNVLITEKIKNDFATSILYVIFKTNGFKAIRNYLNRYLGNSIQELIDNEETLKENPKNRLQNMLQREIRNTPQNIYSIIEASGPAHKKTYKIEASFNGRKLGEGFGKSLKEAEEMAAKAAIIELTKSYNKIFPLQR